jgi:hypothetical protein
VEIELGPGDLLYLPAGCWHDPVALEEDTFGVSFFCNPFDLRTPLTRLLREAVSWRPLPHGYEPGLHTGTPPQVEACLEQLLVEVREWANGLRPEDLAADLLRNVYTTPLAPRYKPRPRSSGPSPPTTSWRCAGG